VPRPLGTKTRSSDDADRALRELGAAVRRERLAREWTLDQLAEATDLDPAYIQRVESGKINVTFRTMHRIATGLGVELADIVRPTPA
jgi:transcriptional regulator with XRE-family HTH domain